MAEQLTAVEKSENFKMYDALVRSGYSSYQLERLAKNVYNEDIAHDSFVNYRKKLPVHVIFHHSLIRKKEEDFDVQIDEEIECVEMIIKLKTRIDYLMKWEGGEKQVTQQEIARTSDQIHKWVYLLAELRGKVKAVINNNTINTQINNVQNNIQRTTVEDARRHLGSLFNAGSPENSGS